MCYIKENKFKKLKIAIGNVPCDQDLYSGDTIVGFKQLYDNRIERETQYRDECTNDSECRNIVNQKSKITLLPL